MIVQTGSNWPEKGRKVRVTDSAMRRQRDEVSLFSMSSVAVEVKIVISEDVWSHFTISSSLEVSKCQQISAQPLKQLLKISS